jgi:Nup93/Nic96
VHHVPGRKASGRLPDLLRGMQGKAHFTKLQSAFAAAMRKLLQCRRSGAPFHALQEFSSVLACGEFATERSHGRVQDIWRVLELQHESWQSAGGERLTARDAQLALLRGSTQFLEREYYEHMEARVRGARLEARSGGSGSAASVIAGYVNTVGRAASRGRDQQARAWQQVYHAMRGGKVDEATAAADPHALALPTMQHVADGLRDWLMQWNAGSRPLPERTARTIQQHADAVLQAGELQQCSATVARAVLAVLSVLCGSSAPLDQAVQGQVPALADGGLASLEDYLWFHSSLASAQSTAGAHDVPLIWLAQYWSNLRWQEAMHRRYRHAHVPSKPCTSHQNFSDICIASESPTGRTQRLAT